MNLRSGKIGLITLIIVLALAACTAAPAAPEATATIPESTATAPPAEPAEPTATLPAAEEQPAATATVEATESGAEAGGLRFEVVSGQSEARYRVREQLASLSLPNDAVGATSQISGSVTVNPDGTIAEGSQFVVNMDSLQTDSSRRDNYVRRNVLQTDRYPEAVFVPKRVVGLNFPLPASGEVSFELVGDLTIRDVTREVTWLVEGTIAGPAAVGLATARFTFADFALTKPNVASVLSIEDRIDLEIDIAIQAAGGE